MRYSQRLQEANDLIKSEHYRQAIETAGGAIENLLRELFDELLAKLPQRDADRLRLAQSKAGPGKGGKMTFGNWVHFYQNERIYDWLTDTLGYNLRYFNPGTLMTILGVRNECTHQDYQPTRAEAELVRNNLIVFLQETDRLFDGVKTETVPVEAKKERAYGHLPAWTANAVPHRDIRDRRFDLGVFAADLGKVAAGESEPEYQDPETFYNLTYITRGLRAQLVSMLRRLSGDSKASSVVHLHTTFGGGKTHTMLAMYHLAKHGAVLAERDDVRKLMLEARVETLPQAQVAVIDGDMLTPSQPRVTPEGITLNTIWGEIAYQLGGPELYELLRRSDEERTAPGTDLLHEILSYAGPSLILMDELLNYATKASGVKVGRSYLVDQLQAFLKALTQAVDRHPQAMLVITMTSHVQEMFGEQALRLYDSLKRILARVERTEITAESTEIYEILRRRLFETVGDPSVARRVAAEYWEYYRQNSEVFPEHVLDPVYKQTLEAAYPFHPELIDVLRDRWGTIQGFQKTRGVLRLLALVVSNLYRRNHGAPLIQIGHIDLGDPEIRQELLNYTGSMHRYESAIGSDIAGLPDSKAEQIDRRIGRDYYKFGLCEGLATSIFLYSHSGRMGFTGGTRPQLWLGVLQPDLLPAMAADALDKLQGQMWYLEQEGALMRLGIDPNLNMMLVQRMDAMRQEERAISDRIRQAIEELVGDRFGRAIVWPDDPREVRDNDRLKLVVGPLHLPWVEEETDSPARRYVEDILNNAGGTHRQYRNTVVFVMAAPGSKTTVENAAIRLLALDDIKRTASSQLTDRQDVEFKHQYDDAKTALPSAVWGAYTVAIAPAHNNVWVGWEPGVRSYRPGDSLSQRVWERLKDGQRLLERFDPDFLLKRDDERFKYLWPAEQEVVCVSALWDYFARYTYLPLLAGPNVLQDTIAWGVERGLFAYCLGDPEGYRFDTIFFEQRVRAEQCVVSDHAWLLNANVARELLGESEPEITEADDRDHGLDVVEPEPSGVGDQLPVVGPEHYAGLIVETRIDPLRWREFFNAVIQPLVQAGAHLEITLNLTADHSEGFDPDLIDLRVRESITQLDRGARIRIVHR